MSGVQFVVDDRGRKTAVVFDLRKSRLIWEDFHDRLIDESRASEPRETISLVKKRLQRLGKLHA